MQNDTIAAIATPPGVGGIGVVRVSGADAFAVVLPLLRRPGGKTALPPSHLLTYGYIIDPTSGDARRGAGRVYARSAHLHARGCRRDTGTWRVSGASTHSTRSSGAGSAHGSPWRIHAARLSQRATRSGAGRSGNGSDQCPDRSRAAPRHAAVARAALCACAGGARCDPRRYE